jgi:hypothetical protein
MRLVAKFLILVLVAASLPSCDPPASQNSADAPQAIKRPKTSIMIRTTAGGPKQEAFLVEPIRDIPFDQLADAVRETGRRCEEVTAFNQLEQNGRRMDVYKVDCGKRSYQVTVLADSTHIKRWTGNVIGE